MHNENQEFPEEFDQNSKIFEEKFLKSSFNEEFLVWQHSKKAAAESEKKPSASQVFKLHVEHDHRPKAKAKPQAQKHNAHSKAHSETQKPERRSVKTVLKDGSRQIFASLIILVIGFLLLNWSAYYQIAKSKISDYMGTREVSPLEELVETSDDPTIVKTTETLVTSKNPDIQKKQIPDLNLEVVPLSNRLVVPRINQNIPVVRVSSENLIKRDWGGLEKDIQDALKNGVVHYPGTSLPDQSGNVVVTGHSSYFPWDAGRFKDVFALLHDVVIGDKIVVYYSQKKYIYEVDDIKIVLPDDINVLKQTPRDQLTLITCTPVGTNLKRLIVTAKLVEGDLPDKKKKIVR